MIRRYAGEAGLRTLIQLLHGPDLYGAVRRFETMPSSPSSQAALNESSPIERAGNRLVLDASTSARTVCACLASSRPLWAASCFQWR